MGSSGRSPGMRHRLETMDPEKRKVLEGNPHGVQYDAHCGARARERYRRQQERKLAKDSKKHFGVAVRPDGYTQSGLIIPGVTEKV